MLIDTVSNKLIQTIFTILIKPLRNIFYKEHNKISLKVGSIEFNSKMNTPNEAEEKDGLVLKIADLKWDIFLT